MINFLTNELKKNNIIKIRINQFIFAEVAELVDALGSGSSEGSLVGVQISPSAYFFIVKSPLILDTSGFLPTGFFIYTL